MYWYEKLLKIIYRFIWHYYLFIVGVKNWNSEITEKLILIWVMSKGFRRNVNGIIIHVQLYFVVYNILWKTYRQKSVKISLFETIAVWPAPCLYQIVIKIIKREGYWFSTVQTRYIYLKKYDVHSSYLTSFRFAFKWILIRVSEWDA
jgi:hypothetical protein